MYKKLLFLVFVLPLSLGVFAQYQFNQSFPLVYSILNTKCQNATCHSASSAESLKFDGTPAQVWAGLVSQPPTNAAALARGEQLVWIDQPYQSYLLQKAAGNWFDTYLNLPANEMDSVHANSGLTNMQVEYIRQWILDSAAQVMLNIDTTIINDYYNNLAVNAPFAPIKQAPPADSGVQVRYGPIFLRNTSGQQEVEYMLMHQINFAQDEEVIKVENNMSSFSHHFLLFQFPDSADAVAQETGLRQVQISAQGVVTPFDGSKNLIAAWQTPDMPIALPQGTAFFWDQKTFIDQDYHIKNYSTYPILPFDLYLNVYTRPRVIGDNTIQMISHLASNSAIVILPNSSPTILYRDPDQTNETRYVWMMSSHTHKFGTGYNIYKYNSAMPQNLGDTLYIGTYDYIDGIPLGVYDWEHPSVEYMEPQQPLNPSTDGPIAQTTWDNTSSSVVTFGFTTSNEMQLFYYMYTLQLPASSTTGIKSTANPGFDFIVAPNPMTGSLGTISYNLSEASTVDAAILDVTGKQVATLKDEKEQSGSYNLDLGGKSLGAGMYFARLTVNGETYTKKFVVE